MVNGTLKRMVSNVVKTIHVDVDSWICSMMFKFHLFPSQTNIFKKENLIIYSNFHISMLRTFQENAIFIFIPIRILFSTPLFSKQRG